MSYNVFPKIAVDIENNRWYAVRANGYIIEGWSLENKEREQVINHRSDFFYLQKENKTKSSIFWNNETIYRCCLQFIVYYRTLCVFE